MRDKSPGQHVKAELARRGIKIHEFAARIRLHPSYLGAMLNGRKPVSAGVAERIRRALNALGEPD
jgi:plasmid maintenance system antidote protein VapI